MRIDLVSKEYPPAIYGGAGVHVAELVKVLRKEIEVQVRAFGADRNEADTTAYQHPSEFDSANAAIQTLATSSQLWTSQPSPRTSAWFLQPTFVT